MSMEVYVKPEEEREVSPIIAIGSVVSLRTVSIPHAKTQGQLFPVFEKTGVSNGQAQAQLTNELSSTGTQTPTKHFQSAAEASNAVETISDPLQNQKTGTYILPPYSQPSVLQPPSTVLSHINALANQEQSLIAPPVQEEIRKVNAELEAREGTSIESNQCNSVSTTEDDNNSYPLCKQIGFDLDLKSKSTEKKKLDPHVLTNGIMYEVHKCAKKADGVYRYAVLSILESNFDLCLDSEQQKIGFSKRVVLKLKRVVVHLRCLARLAEKLSYQERVFTLPDTNNPQKVTPARGVGVLSPVMSSETDIDVEGRTISLVKDEYNLKKAIDRKRLVIKMLREKCDTLKEHKAHLKEAKKERGVKLQRAYRDNTFLFSRYKKMKEKLSKVSVCNEGQRENVRTETDPRLVKLKEKVRFWKQMYTETKDELDSFRTQKVPTLKNGLFNDNIRELYLDLTANKGINCSKVSEVVEAVLNKMLGMKAERLPSASVETNFVLEADQATPSSDTGAAEFVHENAEVCMKDEYRCHLEIREQSTGVEVDQLNIVRKMVQDIVVAAVKDKDMGGHQRGIFAKITHLFDDRVVLETGFKQLISEYQSDILPKMVKWYDFYTHSDKAKLSCVNEVFCGLHLIDSLAHQAKATLLLWEKMIVEDEEVGANRLSDSSKHALESGTVRLVRTVSDAVQAKDGKPEKFKAFLTRKGVFDDVPLAPSRGNRIDALFHNAAGAYSIHEELVEFTTREYLDDNSLLAKVAADFEVQQFKAGCRALGLISKIIIDPLFKSMRDTLKMETRYQTLITKLKEWKEDGRQIVEGTACLFNDIEMPKDLVLERLTMWTDSEFFDLTIQIVEVILASFLKVCCTMMADQLQHKSNHLPDGLRGKLKAVLKSNVSSEKDLSVLNYLMMAKSKATSIALEGMLMFKKNRKWEWLSSLDKQKKESMLTAAQESMKQRDMFRERTRQIERGNLHTSKNMEGDTMDSGKDATAEEKEIPEKTHKTIPERSAVTKRKEPMRLSDALISRKRARNDRHDVSVTQQLTTELKQYGGLWDSVKIIDEQLASLCKESKYSAVVCQLQFRRFVLGMKNERGIFNTSVAGRKLSLDKLVSNLKQNVSTVATEEPQPVLVNASEQGPQSVDGVLVEQNSVRDREPKLSSACGSRKGGRCKTQKNEVMNDGEDQLKNCSRTSKKRVEIQSGMNKNEVLADETLNSEMLESMDEPTAAQESCSVYFEFDFPYGASVLKKAGSTKVAGKQDDTDGKHIVFSVDGNNLSDTRIPVVSHSEQLLGKRVKKALDVDGNIEFFSGTVVKMKEENGVNLFQVKYDDLCIDWWIDLWKEYEQNNVLVLPIDFLSIIGKKVEQRVANDDGQETWRVGDLSSSAKGDTQYAVMQFDGLTFLLVRVCTLLEDYLENRLRILS